MNVLTCSNQITFSLQVKNREFLESIAARHFLQSLDLLWSSILQFCNIFLKTGAPEQYATISFTRAGVPSTIPRLPFLTASPFIHRRLTLALLALLLHWELLTFTVTLKSLPKLLLSRTPTPHTHTHAHALEACVACLVPIRYILHWAVSKLAWVGNSHFPDNPPSLPPPLFFSFFFFLLQNNNFSQKFFLINQVFCQKNWSSVSPAACLEASCPLSLFGR